MTDKPKIGTAWKLGDDTIIVISVQVAQNFDEPGYPEVPLVGFVRLGGCPEGERKERFTTLKRFHEIATPNRTARTAYAPYLVDRADGCKGHYAIGRWNPGGYQEVWNLRAHCWTAASDEVLTLEEATKMLESISFHPMTPSIRSPQ